MDIRCPVCVEPWDNDELHDVPGMTYAQASAKFRKVGCEVFETAHGTIPAGEAPAMARELYALLGSDMDGAAATFDDFGDLFDEAA